MPSSFLPPALRTPSIRRRIGLALLGLGSLPLILVTVINLAVGYRQQIEEQNWHLHEVTRHVAERIESSLHELSTLIENTQPLSDITHMSLKEQRRLLERITFKFHKISALSLLDDEGLEQIAVSDSRLIPAEELRQRAGEDLFIVPMRTGKAFFGLPRHDRSGEPLLPVAVPIKRPGSGIYGIITAELRLREIWRDISDIELPSGARLYVTDGDGVVLMHRNPSVVLRQTRLLKPEGDFLGSNTAASANTLLKLGPYNLNVIAERSRTSILEPILERIAVNVGALCIALGLSWITMSALLRRILVPIEEAADAALGIADGDLSRRLQATGEDEFGQLSRSFNSMADEVSRLLREVRESESRYRKLYEEAPLPYQSLTPTGHLREINPAWSELFGYGRDEAIGRFIGDFMSETSRMVFMAAFSHFAEDGCIQNQQFEIVRKDGSRRLVTIKGTVARDENGRFLHTYCILTDVTERVRATEALRASEAKLRMILDSASDAVFIATPDERWLYLNERIVDLIGYRPEELTGTTLYDIVPEDFRDAYRLAFAELRESRHVWSKELRLVHKDGHRVPVGMSASVLPDGNVYGSCRDITERKQMEAELRIAATTFESQSGIVITDAESRILRVNRAFTELTGYSAEEVLGKTPALLTSGRQGSDFYRTMWDILKRDGYWQGEIWNRRKDGSIYAEWLSISAVTNSRGQVTHYVGSFTDITENKQAAEAMERLAFHDALTDLPNRRALADRLQHALDAGKRLDAHGAVLFLDLDKFKALNDTHGHEAGDLLLIEVGQRLKSCVRQGDTVARLGGDEFVVMLENLDGDLRQAGEQAASAAEKIRAEIDRPFDLPGFAYHTSPSIGVRLFDREDTDGAEVLRHADQAMYEAKQAGRNTVRFYRAPAAPQ